MNDALSLRLSKSISPITPASVLDIPTSITTAPGFTISALSSLGTPQAATTTSAFFVYSFKSFVLLCNKLTVASLFSKAKAKGLPTIFPRPIITTFFPLTSIL